MLRTCENGCLIRCYTIGGDAVQTVEEYCDFGIIETPVATPVASATPTASTCASATAPATSKAQPLFSPNVMAFARSVGIKLD